MASPLRSARTWCCPSTAPATTLKIQLVCRAYTMPNPSDIPPLKAYFAERKDLKYYRQRIFYDQLEEALDRGEYPDVDGNVSYLYLYLAERGLGGARIVSETPAQTRARHRRGRPKGYFAQLAEKLLRFSEAYYGREPHVATRTRHWAYGALIGGRDYAQYLELSEPADVFPLKLHTTGQLMHPGRNALTRLSLLAHLGRPAHPLDLFFLGDANPTRVTRAHSALFVEALHAAFGEAAARDGPWLDRLVSANPPCPRPTSAVGLFFDVGVVAPFPCYTFSNDHALLKAVRATSKHAEDLVRDALGLPRIGEGWIGETELFRAIQQEFGETQVVQHGRPDWLAPQHLDVWFPRWRIAVEYHGEQHFRPIPFFGGERAHGASLERDLRKVRLCEAAQVALIVTSHVVPTEAVLECVHAIRAASSSSCRSSLSVARDSPSEWAAAVANSLVGSVEEGIGAAPVIATTVDSLPR